MPIDLNEHLRQKNKNYKSQQENGGSSNNGGNGANRNFQNYSKIPSFNMPSGKKMAVIYVLIILIVLLFLLKPFTIINSGEVGVKITTGEFSPTPLQPGIHFFIPGIQRIIPVNTKVRIAEFISAEASTFRGRDEGS